MSVGSRQACSTHPPVLVSQSQAPLPSDTPPPPPSPPSPPATCTAPLSSGRWLMLLAACLPEGRCRPAGVLAEAVA